MQPYRIYRKKAEAKERNCRKTFERETIRRIYRYADVFHCEPIAKTADDFIHICNIPVGAYDNLEKAKYEIPDYWTIGEVYERLIEDVSEDSTEAIVDTIMAVYSSWISDAISNYNTDFYYQSREYICQCYTEGEVCAVEVHCPPTDFVKHFY